MKAIGNGQSYELKCQTSGGARVRILLMRKTVYLGLLRQKKTFGEDPHAATISDTFVKPIKGAHRPLNKIQSLILQYISRPRFS